MKPARTKRTWLWLLLLVVCLISGLLLNNAARTQVRLLFPLVLLLFLIFYLAFKGIAQCRWIHLSRAIKKNDFETISRIIEKKNSLVRFVNFFGYSPLQLATRRTSDPKIISYLISKGANVNGQEYNSPTPLMCACQYSSPEVVQILLDHGADIFTADRRGRNAIDFAQNNDRLVGSTALQHLNQMHVEAKPTESNSDISVPDNEPDETCIEKRAENSSSRSESTTVTSLEQPTQTQVNDLDLDQLIESFEEDKNLNTQILLWSHLHKAIQEGENLDIIKKIVSVNGLELNLSESFNTIKGAISTANFTPEIVQLFLENGADVNARDYRGRTPLLHAYDHNFPAEVIDLLISHGAVVQGEKHSKQNLPFDVPPAFEISNSSVWPKIFATLSILFTLIFIIETSLNFYCALLLSIAAHELGHLLAASISNVPIQTYSIGFGPRLFKYTYYGNSPCGLNIEFRLIPLGGYVLPLTATKDTREHYWNWHTAKSKGEDLPQLPQEPPDQPSGSFIEDLSLSRKNFFFSGGLIINLLLCLCLLTYSEKLEHRYIVDKIAQTQEQQIFTETTPSLSWDEAFSRALSVTWKGMHKIPGFVASSYFGESTERKRGEDSTDAEEISKEPKTKEEYLDKWSKEFRVESFILIFGIVNLVLLSLNILPIPPLDGFRILESTLLTFVPSSEAILNIVNILGVLFIFYIIVNDIFSIIGGFFSG